MKEEFINIEDALYVVKKWWRVILSITLGVTVLVGGLNFFVIKPKYESSIKLFIGKEILDDETAYNGSDIEMYQNLMQTYSEIVRSKDLISTALTTNRISEEVNNVLDNLTILASSDTQVFEIKYESIDPYAASNIVNAIKNSFITKCIELIPNGSIKVLEEANIPQKSVSPNKLLNTFIGFLLGFMLSIAVVMVIQYFNSSFRNKDEIERILGLSVIGTIPLAEKNN